MAIKKTNMGQAWWLMSVIPATQEVEWGELWCEASPVQKYKTLSKSKAKRAGGLAQVVELA
jgi:hypothetical protein